MRYVFAVVAALAVVTRATVFAEPDQIQAFVTVIVFVLCAGGYLAVSLID